RPPAPACVTSSFRAFLVCASASFGHRSSRDLDQLCRIEPGPTQPEREPIRTCDTPHCRPGRLLSSVHQPATTPAHSNAGGACPQAPLALLSPEWVCAEQGSP